MINKFEKNVYEKFCSKFSEIRQDSNELMKVLKIRWIDSGYFSNRRRTLADDVSVCIENTCGRGAAETQMTQAQLQLLLQCATDCHQVSRKSKESASKRASNFITIDVTQEQHDDAVSSSLDNQKEAVAREDDVLTETSRFRPSFYCSLMFGDEACRNDKVVRLYLKTSAGN